jgi:hypothetical protein
LESYGKCLHPFHEAVEEARVYLIEVPVEGGGCLLVQVSDAELPGALELALDQIKPAVRAVFDGLVAMSPDEMSVEFGLTLGAETGLVVAKGTSEMHFAVTLGWKRPHPETTINDG